MLGRRSDQPQMTGAVDQATAWPSTVTDLPLLFMISCCR